MTTLAWHDGPGPWVLLFPLIWVFAVAAAIFVLRGRRGGCGRGPWRLRATTGEHAPVAVLGRRFAAGEIGEDEYRRRMSVLADDFGTGDAHDGKHGPA